MCQFEDIQEKASPDPVRLTVLNAFALQMNVTPEEELREPITREEGTGLVGYTSRRG